MKALVWGTLVLGVLGTPRLASGASPAKPGPAAASRDSYDGPPLLLGAGKKLSLGGYGSFGGAYTRFMDRDSGLASFEAALLLDHRLSLGVAGYGFTRTPAGPPALDGSAQQFGAGYGGLAARYAMFGGLPVYGSFGVVLGAGAINLHRDYGWDDEEDWDDPEWDERDGKPGRFDTFLVVQPELMLHANVTRWLRLGATVGYRFTGGVGRFGLEESDVDGVVAGGNVQLGWF